MNTITFKTPTVEKSIKRQQKKRFIDSIGWSFYKIFSVPCYMGDSSPWGGRFEVRNSNSSCLGRLALTLIFCAYQHLPRVENCLDNDKIAEICVVFETKEFFKLPVIFVQEIFYFSLLK